MQVRFFRIGLGLGLGLGFFEEDLDLDLRTADLDLHLDLTVAGLVASLLQTTGADAAAQDDCSANKQLDCST